MKYLTKKHANLLIFGCWLVYIAAYVGRLNYSASMVEIIDALGISNDKGGLVYSCFALSYGMGQLVNGLLCKYYNPKYVVTLALFGSAIVNLFMPISGDYRIMAGLWLLNGVAQSMLYSLIVRTISLNIKSGSITGAIYVMSTTVAGGTALAYGISALFVALDAWKLTFYVAASFLVISAFVWVYIMTIVERAKKNGEIEVDDVAEIPKNRGQAKRGVTAAFITVFIFIGVTAVANGFIKDGVNNWLPKLLRDEFGVDDSLSIILTLLLPIFSIFGSLFARRLYLKLRDHLLVNGILYGVSFLFAFGVYIIYPLRSVAFTMILFIGLACMMAAVNNIITSSFPLDNRDKMDSGLLAGVLDTLCYLGSSLAGILLGSVSEAEDLGWTCVLMILFAFALTASLVCFVISFLSRKKV